MSKRTTKSQTSNLIRKLGSTSSKPVASDQIKSQASGFQTKFNPINIFNFITGGSSSKSSSRNYGNQSSVHSITGKKVKTATQIPQLAEPEPVETGGDSLISLLAKMFSFMQQARKDDIKRRDTNQAFSEEKMSEEQRRHEQFLKILKEYTSIGTTKLTPDDSVGIIDSIKGMFGGIIDSIKGMFGGIMGIMGFIKVAFDSLMGPFKPFKWLLANKSILLKLIRWATGPIGVALLGAAAIAWLANQLKDYFRKNVGNMNVIGPREAQAILENGNPNVIANYPGGYEALADIVKNGAAKAKRVLEGYRAGVITKNELNQMGGEKKLEEMENEPGDLIVPPLKPFPETVIPRPKKPGYNQMEWDKLFGPRYTIDGILKDEFITDYGPLGKVTSAAPAGVAAPVSSTYSATPVSPTPSTSSVNDVIARNTDLVLNDYSSDSGSTRPIVSSSTNSTSSPDKQMSSSATQRDDTAIIDRVFDRIYNQV